MISSNLYRGTVTVLFSVVCLISVLTNTSRAQYLGWDYQEQARTHNTDIQHIVLNISFDQSAKKLIGKVMTTLAMLPGRDSNGDIVFDAIGLTIEKVWLEGPGGKKTSLKFDTSESQKLHITLDRPQPSGKSFTIGIQYTTLNPKKGIYFMGPDSVYTDRPAQIWTQGEGEDNRHWFPTYDYPNDKTTTEMFVTVRKDQSALSNGKLVGKASNKDGTVTWHWVMSHPHSTYLVMLGIGDYKVVEETWRGKPVQYWVYPGWESEAKRIFGLTPDMLEFFSNKTGIEYPWEKYAQIAIADFQYGGMENTTATTLNDYVLFDKKTGVHFSSEGLIAHELAHQWFGDFVTCRSWINMWLNESFATYFEALYREHHDGKDEFDEELQGNQNAALSAEASLGKKPIVAANNYTANHYPRGSTVLNMLRHILGDEGYWASIHHYLDVHHYNNVETNDLKIAVEEATGQNLQWFFDEYVFKDGHPIFDVRYEYEPSNKLVRLHVAQTQERDSLTGTFKMPVDIELVYPNGVKHLETIRLNDSAQSFAIVSPEQPSMVIFDKGNTILKELHFEKDLDEWIYQLAHGEFAIERSQAAQELGNARYHGKTQVIAALKQSINTDKFWATRIYALTSLARTSDSLKGMESMMTELALHDPKVDVRAAAIDLLPRMSDHAMASELAKQALNLDSSYRNRASAMRVIYRTDPALGFSIAKKLVKEKSPRDHVRQVAVDVITETKTEEALDLLIELIGERNIPKWTRWATIGGISQMVSVDSTKVYRVLWALTDNGDNAISGTALNKLADIGDASVLAKLREKSLARPDMKVTYDALLKRMEKRLGK